MKQYNKVTNPATIAQLTFQDSASVQKQAESGLDWSPLGPLGAAVKVGEGIPVLVFNSGATVGYVAFGDYNMAAPTGPTDGIPVLPNEKFILNSGAKTWIRASLPAIFGYGGEKEK